MGYNTKNYTEQGGEKTVIGGELIIKGKLKIEEGGSTEGLPSLPKAENQAASTATTVEGLVTDFNALLTKLKAVGLVEADPEEEPDPVEEVVESNPEETNPEENNSENN